jgi:hypothetical protein
VTGASHRQQVLPGTEQGLEHPSADEDREEALSRAFNKIDNLYLF